MTRHNVETDGTVTHHGTDPNGDYVISSTKPMKIDGHHIPAGTTVSLGPYSVKGSSSSSTSQTTVSRGGKTITKTKRTRNGKTTTTTSSSSGGMDASQRELFKKMYGYYPS